MNTLAKIIVYRYWHITIILALFVYFSTHYLFKAYISDISQINITGWTQFLSFAFMFAPLTLLLSTYQKLNESKDIKGIQIRERKILNNIINARGKDLIITILLSAIFTVGFNGFIWMVNQNANFSLDLKVIIPLGFCYIVICLFWLYASFLSIKELNDFKADIQNRIDKETNKANFNKLISGE